MDIIYKTVDRTITSPLKVICDKIYNIFSDNEDFDKSFVKRKYESNFINECIYFFSYPTQVYDRIYLGSAYNAASYDILNALNIKYIINVTHEISNYFENCYDISYHNIKIRDNGNESIVPYLDESFNLIEQFLETNNGNILVHCYMGSSRSVSIVVHYIARKENKEIKDVIDKIKELRPSINPAINFIDQIS